MQKISPYFQLYLRLALGAGYLTLGLDRLGAWGAYGKPGVSWGDWKHFMIYAADIMRFLPYSVAAIFAATATTCEICFGILLVAGKWTRVTATGSGILTFLFGLSMAISHGITDPIGYSVFTVSAASFLLAVNEKYRWSLDELMQKKNAVQVKSVHL
ncbi:MAG TPA: TQO small subunit DoxD [Chitinophagaceae bacterium]|nr:TQO small subunit DoxD [Chitinophagaceae bacterium]